MRSAKNTGKAGNLNQGLLLIDLQAQTTQTILASEYQSTASDIRSNSRFYHRMSISARDRENTCSFTSDDRKLYANVRISGVADGNSPRRMVVYDLESNRITASLAFETTAAVSTAGDWCITSDANNTYHWSLQGKHRYLVHSICVDSCSSVVPYFGKEIKDNKSMRGSCWTPSSHP